jgi:hypothetical protein
MYLPFKASVYCKRHYLGVEGQVVNLLYILDAEFTGRYNDQSLDGVQAGIDLLDKGNGAGGGFSRAGFCQSAKVLAGGYDLIGGLLNGCQFLEAHLVEGTLDFTRKLQFCKFHVLFLCPVQDEVKREDYPVIGKLYVTESNNKLNPLPIARDFLRGC